MVQEPGEILESRSDFWLRHEVLSEQQPVFLLRFSVTIEKKRLK